MNMYSGDRFSMTSMAAIGDVLLVSEACLPLNIVELSSLWPPNDRSVGCHKSYNSYYVIREVVESIS